MSGKKSGGRIRRRADSTASSSSEDSEQENNANTKQVIHSGLITFCGWYSLVF